jgi:hypothetical protein
MAVLMMSLTRALILLSLPSILHAQGQPAEWDALRAKNPAGVSVTLRLLQPRAFHQGELISAEVNLPEHVPMQTPPAAAYWQFTGLLLDPAGNCGTVGKPCFLSEMEFGLRNGPQAVSDRRSLALNSYLPALAPGRYRVAALARKMVRANTGGVGTTYLYADPPQYAVSEAVEIEIVPATAEWVRQTVAASVAAIRSQPRDNAGYQSQRDAARQLTFLNDPAAWNASLDLLPVQEAVLLGGLSRGRPQARVCELMQSRVSAPRQSASTSYLYRLSEICAAANLPPAPTVPAAGGNAPVQTRGVIGTTPPASTARVAPISPEMTAWLEKRHLYTEDVMSKAAAALAGSLANKPPPAKWDAFATLLARIAQVRSDRHPDPAWIAQFTAEFVGEYPSVEAARKPYLLEMFTSTLDSPQVAQLLESVLDDWKPGDYYEAPHAALRGLYRIDPARARARILAELTKDKTWLDAASLRLLPPGDVPAMDDALIESLARAQRPGGWNTQLSMAAVARYASPKALPRIRAIYESQQDSCHPELMAYFVRVDPAYADRVFHSHPWDMHAQPPRCTVQYFTRTPPLAMHPVLEQYLDAYLMHGDVFIKSTAAQSLARYGTAASLPRLWEAFRYFHDYWKGKGEELERNGEGVQLELALRNAIARGRGWLVTEADLRTMESLCISGGCVQETRQDLESLKAPLRIQIMPQPAGLSGSVAQYFGLEDVEALEGKLSQYPRGTRFALQAPGGPSARTVEEIRRFAAGRGLVVTAP